MVSQIQDALLLTLFTAGVGIPLVSGLASYLKGLRRFSGEDVDAPRSATPASAASPVLAARKAKLPASPALPLAADLLLVDDSAVARTKLRRLFEAAGYQVHLACDGVEALALLAKGRYSLMITDLEMPNMDGSALISACRAQASTASMPILAVSGHEGLRAKFNECREISGIHRKPWIDDLLTSHVATLVTTRCARQAEPVSA
jgi:CheY-like chemotaxis protein